MEKFHKEEKTDKKLTKAYESLLKANYIDTNIGSV